MSKLYQVAIAIVCALLITPINMAPSSEDVKFDSEAISILYDPLTRFAGNIFREARSEEENSVLSPLSIHKALNLILMGADRDSITKQEIENALGYGKSASNTLYYKAYQSLIKHFHSINEQAKQSKSVPYHDGINRQFIIDLWTSVIVKNEEQLKPEYAESIKSYFNSSVGQVKDDQPSTKTLLLDRINNWAKEAEFESDILTSNELDEKFSALLLSAVRLEAFWESAFQERISNDIFYNHGLESGLVRRGTTLSQTHITGGNYIEFCKREDSKYPDEYNRLINGQEQYAKVFNELVNLNFRAVDVPLEGDIHFSIFEPLSNGTGNGLGQLVKRLTEMDSDGKRMNLAKVIDLLDAEDLSVRIDYLSFPKFKFQSEIDLKGPLEAMGVNKMFDSIGAELSGITNSKVFIQKAKHVAIIEANKIGLKAAGVTKIKAMLLMSFTERILISIKNPFMFMIRHHKVPLFTGQVVHI